MNKPRRKHDPEPKPLWMPDIGSEITAYLPQETIRAVVEKHVDKDSLVAKLSVNPPLAKSHNYRFNHSVTLHRRPGEFGGEKWVADE